MGEHTCNTVLSNNSSSTATESACTTLSTKDSSTATDSASINTDSYFGIAKRPQLVDVNKIKSISTRDATWTQQLKVCTDTRFDMPPDDGNVWRKDAQRAILGAKKSMLSVTSDSTCESESTLSTLKGSESSVTVESKLRSIKIRGSSTTAESSSTITDNSFGINYTNNASIHRWKQEAEEIQSPSLKSQLPSSYEPNMMISEVAGNGSRNLSSSTKADRNAEQCHQPVLKVKEKKLGDKISALQQLVSPFGKADTASVLLESCHYIRFLHEQIKGLTAPKIKQGTPFEPQQQAPKQDLRSEGLCLVPVSSTLPVFSQTTTDFSSPIFGVGEPPDEPDAYKSKELFPFSGVL